MNPASVGYEALPPAGSLTVDDDMIRVTICEPTAMNNARNTTPTPVASLVRSCGTASITRFGIAA